MTSILAPRGIRCRSWSGCSCSKIHGWDHETALLTFLRQRPELRCDLGFERMPDQSTLWRSWHQRFTTELRETIETAARTILIKAQDAGLIVPREPDRKLSYRNDDQDDSAPDDQTVLKRAKKITNHFSRIVFPAFSLNRGEGCEIHENAYWGLQTYLGLRENLAANEGARASFTSQRESGHHSDTLTVTTFAVFRYQRFGRCTERPSIGCWKRLQGLRSSFELESSRSTSPKPIRSRATERATKTDHRDERADRRVRLSVGDGPVGQERRPNRAGRAPGTERRVTKGDRRGPAEFG